MFKLKIREIDFSFLISFITSKSFTFKYFINNNPTSQISSPKKSKQFKTFFYCLRWSNIKAIDLIWLLDLQSSNREMETERQARREKIKSREMDRMALITGRIPNLDPGISKSTSFSDIRTNDLPKHSRSSSEPSPPCLILNRAHGECDHQIQFNQSSILGFPHQFMLQFRLMSSQFAW